MSEMNGNLIAVMFFITFIIILVSAGFGEYVNQRYERDLKIACIDAGNTLIEDSYIGEETK